MPDGCITAPAVACAMTLPVTAHVGVAAAQVHLEGAFAGSVTGAVEAYAIGVAVAVAGAVVVAVVPAVCCPRKPKPVRYGTAAIAMDFHVDVSRSLFAWAHARYVFEIGAACGGRPVQLAVDVV